jgi:hypothetical protein
LLHLRRSYDSPEPDIVVASDDITRALELIEPGSQ